jgi:hypothetical protein
MSNMGYCRFQNTMRDLADCQRHMEDGDALSDEEKRARARLVRICSEIAVDYAEGEA